MPSANMREPHRRPVPYPQMRFDGDLGLISTANESSALQAAPWKTTVRGISIGQWAA